MPPSLVNRVAVRFALIAAFLIPATIFSCMSTTWLITIAAQVENCHEIIGCLKDLGTLLRDAETGQRGFLLTGNAEYLSPYDEATTLIERKLDTLAALARSDHPSQTRMAEELKLLVREKLAELSETIRFQTAGDVEAALRLVKTGRGIQVMTKIRNLVEFSDSYEQRRLQEAAATARVVRRIMVALNVACTLATLLLLFTVFHHISREIRERTRAEEELARAKDVAESTTRVKSEFLANMSHEIRTPMNGIMGMTDLLLETELSSRQREYLGLVKASADSLLTVINDILDYSKIEAGKFQLLPLPFQFRDIMEETVRTLALRAHAKGLELACRIAPDVPDRLVGDYGRLRQILVNLVGNAIKFTERGEIFLQAELQGGAGDGEVNIHFSVIDTGVGIAAEKLVSIFEPFEQADSSTTRYYGGTGLGLAISGKLVRSMGGQIWVESRVGLGSTFHFTARFSRQSKTATIGESQVRAPFEGARVLVVDDNATNRRILIEVLTNWDIDAVAVDSGPAALTSLQGAINLGRPFAVAILDMMMPAMDGQELANRIRADPAFSGTCLLLMSSDGTTDQASVGRLSAFDGRLSKPLRQSELYDTLASILGISSVASIPSPTSADNAQGHLDSPPHQGRRTRVNVLVAEDHPVNQKLVAWILEEAGHRVAIVGDGRQAVDAFEAGRFDVVLMDVQMPVMDGFEAVARIRALPDPSRARIPIIALTAHAMKGDRERCLTAGFDGYLSKPIRAELLLEAIDRLFPATCVPHQSGEQLIDGLAAQLGGNEDFAREIVATFLKSAALSRSAIASALQSGDMAQLAFEAHGLKGACLTIGADDLAGLCKRLEHASGRNEIGVAREATSAVLSELAGVSVALEEYLGTHT